MALGALGVIAYAWWIAGLPAFSTSTALAVLVPGGVALIAGRRLPPRHVRRLTWRRLAPWLAVATALAAVQLAAYVHHPRAEHPTLSWLASGALEARPTRAFFFAVWLVAAAGLGRR